MQTKIIANRYRTLKLISEDSLGTLYQAVDSEQDQPVFLKLFNESIKQKSLETVLLFKSEIIKLSKYRHPHVMNTYEIGEDKGRMYIVEEYEEGGFQLSSLIEHIDDIDTMVAIMLQVSSGLDSAHQRGILHRMVNPSSIILFKTDHKITAKVTDFGKGLVTDFARIEKEEVIRAFGYLSPEATGILRKPVDERSDIYSLGILFYQLLTGLLPYRAQDISTLIHKHIAQKPTPPTQFNRAVPKVIEEMVLRMIAKDPLDRYQSLSGLITDLRTYQKQRGEGKEVITFEIARADRAKELTYTTRFIGREHELKALQQGIEESRQDRGSVCLVYGEPGVGKSRLLDELRGYAHGIGGIFIGGRTSRSEIKTPYEVFSEAINAYVEKVKRRSKADQEQVIKRIKESVGELGQEVVNIAPSIIDLIGEQSELVALEPDRARIRFIITVTNLLVHLGIQSMPVVLFLDDFQWVDEGSLELFESVADKIGNAPLVLIAGYRDTEVGEGHQVKQAIERIKGKGIQVREVPLKPFIQDETGKMISQLLMEEENTESLVEQIYIRTEGNPFFILELLHALVDSGIVYFQDNHYRYDMNKLKGASLPTNIVEVVLNRIEDIAGDEQRVLSYASVMGREIEFELLVEITGMSGDIVLRGIEEGIKERFLVKDLTSAERIYFAHDRIRDAFYTRVPQEKKIPLHKHVGEALERKHSDTIDHVLYDIAHHFTLAQIEEKTLYYSLQAGKKAQAGYAHDQSIKLYEKAREILERQKKTKTDEYVDLLVRLGTAYKASSRYDDALEALNTCESLIQEKDVIRKAEVLSIVGDTLLEKGEKEKIVEVLLQALKLLGVKLPQNIAGVFSGISIESTIWTFHRLFPGLFVRKEYKHDPKTAVIIHILNRLNHFYYFFDMNKCLHVMYKTLNMADRMGPSRELVNILSTWTVGWSGIPWPGRAKKDGLRAVKVGQELNDRAAEGRALGYFADSALNNRSAEECYDLAVKSVELLKGVGEYWDLGLGMAHVSAGAMLLGKNIEDVLKENEEMIKIAESANSIQGWGWLLYHKTHALAIIGDERLKTEGIKDAELSIQLQQKALDKPSELWSTAILAFAHLRAGNWDKAIETAEQVKKLIRTHNNMAGWIWDLHNICAQVYLESAQHKPNLSEDEKKEYLKKAKHSCRRARIRARLFPYMRGWTYKVKGTCQWLEGRKEEAVKTWEKGIAYVRENTKDTYRLGTLLLEEASFLLKDNPEDKKANEYLIEAKEIFSQLGAKLDLERANKLLRAISQEEEVVETRQTLTLTRHLDSLLSLTKSIGSIFVLDELLNKIVEQAMQVTGAERGFLLLYDEKDNTLKQKVARGIEEELSKQPFSYENYKISLNMVQECEKAGTGLFIAEDSATFPQVSGELKECQVRQAMCIPLTARDKALGIIYLDNRLAGGTFGENELELMKSFAMQASISVENAYLVRGLIESEEKYRLISENTSDLISVTTLDGTYTYVSQSHRQYGYEPEKLLGRSGLELVHPDDREWMKELMREYARMRATKLETGEVAPIMRSLEYRFATKAGEWRYLGSTTNLIFDSLGNPISFLVVSRDITDRKNAEREAKLHQEQLIQAAKMVSLGTLVSGVAHEINNPISYIMLNAPILQKVWNDISPILDKHCRNNGDFSIANMSYSQLSERIPLLLSGVVDGTRRVAAIVSDLKEFSRQSPPELTDMVDINNEVKKAVGLLTNLIKKSTDHVSVSNEPDIPLFKGNAQRVEQVIINLIVNACQSLKDSTKEVSISTFYDSEYDSVVIEVRDQGEGMTPDVLKRIRDPFFTMKRESGGTGLGLAISDRIVAEHGGNMDYVSTEGHGTTVRVSFPVKTRVTEKRGA